jgi:hypothetical protein
MLSVKRHQGPKTPNALSLPWSKPIVNRDKAIFHVCPAIHKEKLGMQAERHKFGKAEKHNNPRAILHLILPFHISNDGLCGNSLIS